jgi:hypothetical protein
VTVDVTVGRLDLLRFNLATLFRIRANLIMFLMLWALIVVIVLKEFDWSVSDMNIPLALALTFVGALAAFLFLFGFMLIFMLLTVTKKSGWIGNRSFSIEDRGIREVTQANDSIHMWESILDVREAAKMLMVRVNQFNFFLLPRHGFGDPDQFEPFCAEVMKRWRDSKTE